MNAKSTFNSNINRVKKIINVYNRMNKTGSSKIIKSELLRLGFVFTMATLDAYLHEVIGGNLVKFIKINLKSINQDQNRKARLSKLEKFIKETITPYEFLEIMGRSRPYSIFRNKMEYKIFQHTYQSPDRIESAFELFGQTGFWEKLQNSGKSYTKGLAVKEMLENFYERRNQIAHEMDRFRAKKTKSKVRNIELDTVNECMTIVIIIKNFVEREFWDKEKKEYIFMV